jgi:1-acylglycerone phosphate reductase
MNLFYKILRLGAYCDVGIYNSSKAAVTSLSETLRIEMAPLGVRVVTVILGAVGTTGNDPTTKGDLELPAGSYYKKITAIIDRHKKALVFPRKQNVDVAAKNVVNDVLSGRSIFIRRGDSSTLSWFGNTFLPHALFTSMINGESGLDKMGNE